MLFLLIDSVIQNRHDIWLINIIKKQKAAHLWIQFHRSDFEMI